MATEHSGLAHRPAHSAEQSLSMHVPTRRAPEAAEQCSKCGRQHWTICSRLSPRTVEVLEQATRLASFWTFPLAISALVSALVLPLIHFYQLDGGASGLLNQPRIRAYYLFAASTYVAWFSLFTVWGFIQSLHVSQEIQSLHAVTLRLPPTLRRIAASPAAEVDGRTWDSFQRWLDVLRLHGCVFAVPWILCTAVTTAAMAQRLPIDRSRGSFWPEGVLIITVVLFSWPLTAWIFYLVFRRATLTFNGPIFAPRWDIDLTHEKRTTSATVSDEESRPVLKDDGTDALPLPSRIHHQVRPTCQSPYSEQDDHTARHERRIVSSMETFPRLIPSPADSAFQAPPNPSTETIEVHLPPTPEPVAVLFDQAEGDSGAPVEQVSMGPTMRKRALEIHSISQKPSASKTVSDDRHVRDRICSPEPALQHPSHRIKFNSSDDHAGEDDEEGDISVRKRAGLDAADDAVEESCATYPRGVLKAAKQPVAPSTQPANESPNSKALKRWLRGTSDERPGENARPSLANRRTRRVGNPVDRGAGESPRRHGLDFPASAREGIAGAD